jgi:hypothetical protein
MTSHEDQFLKGLMSGQLLPQVPSQPVEKVAEEPQARSVTQKNLFSNPDTSPVVLDFALLKQFKVEWIGWLPDTLFSEIEREFKTSIADVNRIKIQATQTLHAVDTFWEEWEIFEKTIHALNGQIPLVEHIQPLELPQLYVGVDIANNVRKETFNEEVSRYCAATFLYEHVHYALDPLEFCQQYVTQPVYVCADCDKTASALPPWDGVCESCGGHYRTETPFAFKADPELVKQGLGKNVKVRPTYDPEPVKRRYEELSKLQQPKLSQTIREVSEDIQAAKLIIAHDHMSHHRQQMADQLKALRYWLEATS